MIWIRVLLPAPFGTDQTGQAGGDVEADIVQPHDHAVPAAQFPRLDDWVHSGLTRYARSRRPGASMTEQGHARSRRDAGFPAPSGGFGGCVAEWCPEPGCCRVMFWMFSPTRKVCSAIWFRLNPKPRCRSHGSVCQAMGVTIHAENPPHEPEGGGGFLLRADGGNAQRQHAQDRHAAQPVNQDVEQRRRGRARKTSNPARADCPGTRRRRPAPARSGPGIQTRWQISPADNRRG